MSRARGSPGACCAPIVFGLLIAGCAAEPVKPVVWRGHALREVRSLASLPASIVSSLSADPGDMQGVADRGRPFNATDVINNSLPMCRLVTAGESDTTWLVALEVGGRGRHVEVFQFSGSDFVLAQRWTVQGQPRTLTDVARLVSSPDAGEDP